MKNNNGITLIALIITIIILLILVGVSINTLVEENSVFNKAQYTGKKTNEAEDEEQRQFTIAEAAINFENTIYVDPDTKKEVPIPLGFAVSQVKGESTVSDGLVIIDSKGNEFVWIPVEKTTFDEKFKRTDRYSQKKLQDFLRGSGEANQTGFNSLMDVNGISESNDTKQEAIKMYESVKNNGGFYIGRYETGKDTNGEIVCKKNVEVYRSIRWGNSMTDDTGGVVEIARKFSENNNYSTVTSTLCYGVQWDATLNFIDPNYITNAEIGHPICEKESYLVDSTNKGNYTGEIAKTGSSSQYKQKNVYDMAGNLWEWTMECCGMAKNRVVRGGSCKRNGIECPSSSVASKSPNIDDDYFGFRICLFLN